MIGLTPMFDPEELEREMLAAIEEAMLPKLIQIGQRAVDIARKKMGAKPYQDQTGNLRSSTGFVVYLDGKEVHRDFKLSTAGTDKFTGLTIGQQHAEEEMRDAEGWGMILVAGMEYASWVENRGYDVITGGKNNALIWLTQAFNELGIIE